MEAFLVDPGTSNLLSEKKMARIVCLTSRNGLGIVSKVPSFFTFFPFIMGPALLSCFVSIIQRN